MGGCFIFTIMAAVAIYIVSVNAYYSLLLGLAAHLQLFVAMGAFSFVLGRRMRLKGGRDGFDYHDTSEPETPADGAKLATQAGAAAGQDVVEELERKE